MSRVLLNHLACLGLANKALQGITQTRLQNSPQNHQRLLQQLSVPQYQSSCFSNCLALSVEAVEELFGEELCSQRLSMCWGLPSWLSNRRLDHHPNTLSLKGYQKQTSKLQPSSLSILQQAMQEASSGLVGWFQLSEFQCSNYHIICTPLQVLWEHQKTCYETFSLESLLLIATDCIHEFA